MALLNTIVEGTYAIVARALPKGHRPYRLAGGKVYLNLRESPMMLARVLRMRERAKSQALTEFLKPGQTFVDVGANKGEFSLLASQLVGPGGQVLSFEPEPENSEWIRRSIELNERTNIRQFELALSDENGTAEFYLGEKSGWHTLVPDQPRRDVGRIEVETRTLDSLLAEQGIEEVHMMKIDVEGAELSVLRGATETLRRSRDLVLLLDVHPRLGVDPKQLCVLLTQQGYSIHAAKRPYNPISEIPGDLHECLARRKE